MTTSLCCRAKTDPVPRETMPTAAKDSSDPQRQRMKDNGERSSRDHRLAGWKRGAASGTLLIKLKLNYDSLKLSFSIMIHPSSTNPILIHPLLPTSLPVSTPNNIHHSRLTVCLTDSGSSPLPIEFVLVKHL